MYMNNYSINKIADKRTIAKTKHDFLNGFANEERIMKAMGAICFLKGIDFDYKKIDETEGFADGKFHYVPDYFVFVNGVKKIYEIKCSTTKGFTERNGKDYIFVKPQAIWTMLKDKTTYPNGKLLVATNRKYATLTADQVNSYALEEVEEWGNKQAYVIPVDELK